MRPRLRRQGHRIRVDYVDAQLAHWQQTAADLIALFKAQLGNPYTTWAAALEAYEADRIDYIVIRGLAKVLEDQATFSPPDISILPAEARDRLFAHGPVFSTRDLFNLRTRSQILAQVARSFKVTSSVLETALFADRFAEHILRDVGDEWTPETLLSRYNLELTRGVLYWASEMHVEIYDNFKDFWRYLKLFKLMFEASPLPDGGYHVKLDGPISPFVSSTIRYGRQFAAFLPALLLGDRWHMRADIRSTPTDDPAEFTLDHTSPLTSHFKRSGQFDSRLESDFALQFEEKFGGERGQWVLNREDEVLLLGDTVFIPDFSLTHKTEGRRALVEIVGFWHPEYLRRKIQKVRAAGLANLILLVYQGVNLAPERLVNIPGEVLYFPNKPVLKDVMAAVERRAQ